MSDKWKDIFIIITLGIMAVLAGITLVDFLLVKTFKLDEAITIGFIGAILGGTISGGLTLGGVSMTIKHEKREKFLENYPKFISNYDYLYYWAFNAHGVTREIVQHDEVNLGKLRIIDDGLNALLKEYNDVVSMKAAFGNARIFNLINSIFQELSELRFYLSVVEKDIHFKPYDTDIVSNLEKIVNNISTYLTEIEQEHQEMQKKYELYSKV